ncbi:MAG: hypothetical protein AAF830_13220 [Pseudomonadota bacterium]
MKNILSAAASVALLFGSAFATTIDFNGIGSNFDDPVTVDGFTFDYIDRNGWAISEASGITNEVGNGTEFITCRDTGDFNCAIVMTSATGGSFELFGFDIADHSLGFGGQVIDVRFDLAGGGSVTQSFTTVADVFSSAVFSPLGALSAVVFRNNGVSGNDGFALDNLQTAASEVPVPPAALLMAGVLALYARRKA